MIYISRLYFRSLARSYSIVWHTLALAVWTSLCVFVVFFVYSIRFYIAWPSSSFSSSSSSYSFLFDEIWGISFNIENDKEMEYFISCHRMFFLHLLFPPNSRLNVELLKTMLPLSPFTRFRNRTKSYKIVCRIDVICALRKYPFLIFTFSLRFFFFAFIEMAIPSRGHPNWWMLIIILLSQVKSFWDHHFRSSDGRQTVEISFGWLLGCVIHSHLKDCAVVSVAVSFQNRWTFCSKSIKLGSLIFPIWN